MIGTPIARIWEWATNMGRVLFWFFKIQCINNHNLAKKKKCLIETQPRAPLRLGLCWIWVVKISLSLFFRITRKKENELDFIYSNGNLRRSMSLGY